MTAPGANSKNRSARAGVPLDGSAPVASNTIHPVSLLPFSPHDFPSVSPLRMGSPSRLPGVVGKDGFAPHGSRIISVTRPIALARVPIELPLEYIYPSMSLVVQFMKGRGTRLPLAHDNAT